MKLHQCACTVCGEVGMAKTVTKGSILIELILWLFFILPGLIYSMWRLTSRHQACPTCGSSAIVPLESPIGRQILSKR